MSHSSMPNCVYSYFCPFETQTTHGSGGRRPSRAWQPGQPLGPTRLTIVKEVVASASLPHDYPEFARRFNDTDAHVRDCVAQGWPMRTACARSTAAAAGGPRGAESLFRCRTAWSVGANLGHVAFL